MKKVLTLAMIYDDRSILLGLKKRGFGSGKWNGFGGKVQEGESLYEAVIRELAEESGLSATKIDKKGKLSFYFDGKSETLEVHVFQVLAYSGTISESDEMRPQWFSRTEIPYDQMWPDDAIWLPLLLQGKKFCGSAYFRDEQTLIRHTIRECDLEESLNTP